MKLAKAIISTPVTRPGMLIGEALQICVDKWAPGLPYVGSDGEIAGRFSVRHTFLELSIPSDVVKGAHLIGRDAKGMEPPADQYDEIFSRTIDSLIIPDISCLASSAQITKAMALMEKMNSSHMFVADDGHYLGVVTRLGLTRILLEGMA